ncbi:nuclear transport factor 2 family protein [Galbibacter sp. BG1]|uniref:nuclear transport factor 2 family protein n=1 Tax=Galbibacter sp. BG1 TaxID=1170699 RepID=UPI0015C0F75C|nr:nuclear transport factor 2 family protein [Galbibacter sp. BG1]QLE02926.1 nuclear transport factor 2 family protein [Galbibacter sp. BG1]
MKIHNISFLLLLSFFIGTSQNPVENEVKNKINDFFEAFHQQDTTALKSYVSDAIVMQTVVSSENGESELRTQEFGKFLKSIASIPSENNFKEELLDCNVKIDGAMAHAWTPYKFWYNGKLSHCGVNSFQLIKEVDTWKIIYVVDTRRKTGCE